MSSIYQITKLDGRHRGYPTFTHYVTIRRTPGVVRFRSDFVSEFSKLREWCRVTWGTSFELEDYDYIVRYNQMWSHVQNKDFKLNEFWAWHVENNTRRIYLTERGKAWFDLSWA